MANCTPDAEFAYTPMPKPPTGFAACRVHDGRQSLLADGATRQTTHLVALDEKGSNGGRPTVCGLSRFDRPGRPADLPGWSMGGGISGPNIEQDRCERCWSQSDRAEETQGPDVMGDYLAQGWAIDNEGRWEQTNG